MGGGALAKVYRSVIVEAVVCPWEGRQMLLTKDGRERQSG